MAGYFSDKVSRPLFEGSFFGVGLFMVSLALLVFQYVTFSVNVTQRIQCACEAATVDVALHEIGFATSYLEKQEITRIGAGYTVFSMPKHDVVFWYTNLLTWRDMLRAFDSHAVTGMEKNALLTRMRESLLDQTALGARVVQPPLVFFHPYAPACLFLLVLSLAGLGICTQLWVQSGVWTGFSVALQRSVKVGAAITMLIVMVILMP